MVLIIGSNDVSESTCPEELAHKLITLATTLIRSYRVQQVVLCKLLPCFPKAEHKFIRRGRLMHQAKKEDCSHKSMYRQTAKSVNKILTEEAR